MSNYRKFISEEEYKIQLQACVDRFSKDFFRSIGSTVFVKTEKNLVTAVSGNDTACLSFEFQGANRLEHIFLTLLREACDKAEGISGCSSRMLVGVLLAILNKKQTVAGLETFITTTLYETAIPVTPASFNSIISNVVDHDEILTDIIQSALELAGFESKIIIDDKTSEAATLIEYREGYTFQTSPARSFCNQPNSTWDQKNVKVLLIDGLIESVSELHSVLSQTYSTKLPLLLVARGFSEEVIATLKANQTYDLLNAIPVKINSDLESINILNDIATVCGARICSSLTGDIISLVDYEALPTVESVFCSGTNLSIVNNKTKGSVNQHIKHLLEKKEATQGATTDLGDLIDKRIKCLVSSNVVIKLPNISEARKDIMKANLDLGFRTAKAAINYGVVDRKKLFEKCGPELKGILEECLKDIPDPIPALALAAALKLGASTAALLLSASVVLEKD